MTCYIVLRCQNVRGNRAGRRHGVKPSSDKEKKVDHSEGVRLKTSEGFNTSTRPRSERLWRRLELESPDQLHNILK